MAFMKAIAAMAENRVIGHGSVIPWRLPEDFKWFKQTTVGNTLLMGRKTFESIGRPLPGRVTLVVSHQDIHFPGAVTISDWKTIPDGVVQGDLFIAGGATIYEQTLPYCSDLFLTAVKQQPEGDVFFPLFEDRFTLKEIVRETSEFTIRHYINPNPLSRP